jgi:hypothetical protein
MPAPITGVSCSGWNKHSRISGNSRQPTRKPSRQPRPHLPRRSILGRPSAKRGPNCRQRELDEQTAATALREATANKATTDASKRYEAQIGAVKAKLANPEGAAIAHANPLGNALALIIGSTADVLTARMQAIIALVFDLCLVGLMIGIEALGHVPASLTRSEHGASVDTLSDYVTKAQLAIAPPRPTLVTASNEPPPGSIPKIMTAALEPAAGNRVELEEAFSAYAGACEAEGKRAVPPGQFVEPLKKFCKAAGIRIKDEANQVYLMNVQLTGAVSHSRRDRLSP